MLQKAVIIIPKFVANEKCFPNKQRIEQNHDEKRKNTLNKNVNIFPYGKESKSVWIDIA